MNSAELRKGLEKNLMQSAKLEQTELEQFYKEEIARNFVALYYCQ